MIQWVEINFFFQQLFLLWDGIYNSVFTYVRKEMGILDWVMQTNNNNQILNRVLDIYFLYSGCKRDGIWEFVTGNKGMK